MTLACKLRDCSSFQCFPKGVDMMAALDLYFQVCRYSQGQADRTDCPLSLGYRVDVPLWLPRETR